MSDRDTAVAIIRQEHRSLRRVVAALQQQLDEIAAGHDEPDFALLGAAVYYIDEFPERYHHPKEDRHLFKALRARTPRFNDLLDDLQAEHIRSGQTIRYLQRALIHYLGGAPTGLKLFSDAVDACATLLEDHMHKEEKLLSEACEYLSTEDWREIAAAFKANEDPMFGNAQREEFRRLYDRIVNPLPRKPGMSVRREKSRQ